MGHTGGVRRFRFLGKWMTATLFASFVFGCGEKAPPTANPPAANPTAGPQAVKTVAPMPSDAEAKSVAQTIENAVKANDKQVFGDFIDWDGVIKQAIEPLALPLQAQTGYRRGVLNSVNGEAGLTGQILKQVAAGGSYRFLRVRELDGQKTIVFRLLGDSGVNYHEYLLRDDEGKWRASDIYIFLSAERISETLRRSAIPLAQQLSRGWLEKLTKSQSAYIANFEKISRMADTLRTNPAETLNIYQQLPAEVQQDKNVLLFRYQAASAVGEQELIAAIEDFRKFHPNDVGVDFLLIDYLVLKAEFDEALTSIDRLDKSVGGDPYLDTLRAEIVVKQKDVPKALQLAEQSVRGAPDIIEPHLTLISLLLESKSHARTLAGLRHLEQNFKFNPGDVSGHPIYADFVKSPEGVEWVRTHPR